MFANESEMVSKLVYELQHKYNIQYIVRELRNGKNIADVVYSCDLERTQIVFDEYLNAYYYFENIYNNKKINIDQINISDKKTHKKFKTFLLDLEQLGYIRVKDNYIETIKRIDAVTKNLIAVEAKISDWKSGIEQANRYKLFANEVYVAISEDYIHKVDRNEFQKNNIGLMSVNKEEFTIHFKPQKIEAEKLDIQFYLMDRFLAQCLG